MLSVWPLGHFDDTTELTPDHTNVLEYCFWFAGLVALASSLVCLFQSTGKLIPRLLMSLFCFALLGGLSALLVTSTIANIIENWRDFPPQETQTYWTLLTIQRAYRMDSRTGSSWIIQPAPIWSNIDIAHADYSFMLKRLGSDTKGSEPSSLPSRSYFCAKVMMQRSGEALRVLHAGRQALPLGTIGVCSEMMVKQPALQCCIDVRTSTQAIRQLSACDGGRNHTSDCIGASLSTDPSRAEP